MEASYEDQARELLEKAAADLDPELLTVPQAKAKLRDYAQLRSLVDFAITTLSARVDRADAIAKVTGTSVGKAKQTVATGKVLGRSPALSNAFQSGGISLEQAVEIAKAEQSTPGIADDLVKVARKESFETLKDKARKAKLDAEQHRGLAQRQRAARNARSRVNDLGMVEILMCFEPHVGTPFVSRAEAEAKRLYGAAKKKDKDAVEPYGAYLADAYAKMLASDSTVKPSSTRPELVVLVSHEVAQRGWKDVRDGEHCHIPGVGPIAPETAKQIAADAFMSGVVFDGKDLRHFKRFGRRVPKEVMIALELGEPPAFDGPRCCDCGARFHLERDHVEPVIARGPSSTTNLKWRCWPCHDEKTARDRLAGKLKPPEQGPPPRPERGRPERGRRKPQERLE